VKFVSGGGYGCSHNLALMSTSRISFISIFLRNPRKAQEVLTTLDDNCVWSWGSGTNGQLGMGNTEDLAIPTKIPFFIVGLLPGIATHKSGKRNY
jgi:alpha-tubulin suppressor-like RCC1 family protein